jgi:type 1 fimbria pilin
MWLSSILNSLSPRSPHARTRRRPSPRQRPAARRLILEVLEDRCLLSSYSFTPIADTGPNSPYSGLEVRPAINDLGAVAFVANLKSGGAGIFTHNPDGSQGPIIAVTNDLLRTFTLSPFMNDGGTVSFGAKLKDGSTAIYTGRGQELTHIADTGPNSPYSSLPSPAPRIQSDGTVTFHGTLRSGGMGLFAGNGGLPSTFYVTGDQFSAFLGGPASQVHGNTLAFRATLPDGTGGEFTGSGGPTTTIATTGPVFSSFVGGEINDAGTLAISANLTGGGQAIVVAQGGALTRFVDTTGAYSQFFAGQLSINNDGQIVFEADLAAGGRGIFQGPDPVADKILATGDELFGSTVVDFPTNPLSPRGLNNAGQIGFNVRLADGRTVLVLADPDPETVESVVLNDGAAQRSMVNSLTVTFSGAATLDPGAIELRRQDGTLVDFQLAVSAIDGKTVAVLTFAGSEFVGGSLADGSYTLTVRADRVHDRWGRELDRDGNGSAGGDRVDGFFRLFGDSDGDGDVDRLDRDLFRSAFKTTAGEAGYLWYLDFDGNGEVDGRDNGQFNRRFGQD